MIRITVKLPVGPHLNGFLEYVTEKMAAARSDAHDTATSAYVMGRMIRDAAHKRELRGHATSEHSVFNGAARALTKELGMYLGFTNERPGPVTDLCRDIRDQLAANIDRQTDERWREDRERIARNRPTVREQRK